MRCIVFSRMNCCFQLKAPVRISRILPFLLAYLKIVSNDSIEVETKEQAFEETI